MPPFAPRQRARHVDLHKMQNGDAIAPEQLERIALRAEARHGNQVKNQASTLMLPREHSPLQKTKDFTRNVPSLWWILPKIISR